ncbi:MAG: hypothetical protein KC422_05970 [Trueperaceae bacterium]|nr:hypothetical protein [Trueperaceae bacterium]
MRKLLILLVVAALTLVHATTFEALSFEDMLAKAEIAFYGTVTATTVVEQDGEPWTQVSFEVLEPYRGVEEDSSSLELLFYGGQSATVNQQVSLMPSFTVGEKLILFAYDAQYYSPIVGFNQGLWREMENGFRGEAGDLLSLEGEQLVLTGQGLSPEDLLTRMRQSFEVEP